MADFDEEQAKKEALTTYRTVLKKHEDEQKKVKELREENRKLSKQLTKTEDDLKALQSVGQIIGEVLRQLDAERFIVKASSGPRYVVGCKTKIDKEKLTQGTRVALDMTTLTIMRILPREVDPLVHNMLSEDPGEVSYSDIGGLGDQVCLVSRVNLQGA
uniref:Proteasomal ATPase second OB domain-containing protein n=1 Tax=Rhodosorus marinus TaxID=101924 RepID=A0A7S3A5U4_9RHOD|mmetsp:Transcript_4600/g.19723  ORF Transcript_4600/g.19723 Transcript_4600/m.19723 type:complete len:159 (+) Transcript_4600:244-720(+)